MKKLKLNNGGFTLVELLLAMSLFTAMLVISTAGFIAMNRTFTRGTLKRQLSEAVQRATEDVSRTVRQLPQDGTAITCLAGRQPDDQEGCPIATDWNVICMTGARYFWQNTNEVSGLYKDTQECNKAIDPVKADQIMDERYKAQAFAIKSVGSADASIRLFTISGLFRTAEDGAFKDLDQIDKTKCLGSVTSPLARTCALERFSVTINARGQGE